MKAASGGLLACMILTLSTLGYSAEKERLKELDTYWAEAARAVKSGDFAAYQATFHEDAVLVSDIAQQSYPIAKAFARWREGFEDTRQKRMKAGVEFRFSKRIGDESTAHETGIFHYFTVNSKGETEHAYIHFECLLVKKDGWKAVMEYHKSMASPREWQQLALASPNSDRPSDGTGN